MCKLVYLQRHGESETNVKKIFSSTKINPDGESFQTIESRRKRILKKYFSDADNDHMILVGHCAFFAYFLSQYGESTNIKDYFLNRGGIVKFALKGNNWNVIY